MARYINKRQSYRPLGLVSVRSRRAGAVRMSEPGRCGSVGCQNGSRGSAEVRKVQECAPHPIFAHLEHLGHYTQPDRRLAPPAPAPEPAPTTEPPRPVGPFCSFKPTRNLVNLQPGRDTCNIGAHSPLSMS